MAPTEHLIKLASANAERHLLVANDRVVTMRLETNGKSVAPARHEPELVVLLDRSLWRYDINHWKWARVTGERERPEWTARDFDDASWPPTPHLHAIHDAAYNGSAAFRHWFTLPTELAGEPLTFEFGGFDAEDWLRYELWVNGEPLATYPGGDAGRLTVTLEVEDEARRHLRFGSENLLVIKATGLRRPAEKVPTAEREHLFFQGWLLNQHIMAGDRPTWRISDFRAMDSRQLTASSADIDVVSESIGLEATLSYRLEGDICRKQVTVKNAADRPITLLDVRLDAFSVQGDKFTGGGRGQPAFCLSAAAGVEHPAGLALPGDSGTCDLWQWPGVRLGPEESYSSGTAMVVGAAGDTSQQRFAHYLWQLRSRRRQRVTVYSPLGWYDFTNPGDARPELSHELVEENLEELARLQDDGVNFGIYMFDDWWEPSNLGKFRIRTFPYGHEVLARRIRELGMGVGLWVAPSRALWTARELPGVEASLANDLMSESVDYGEGGWSWDDEFAGLFLREERYCLASGPFGEHFSKALPKIAEDLSIDLLKLDVVITHCTSSRHNHMPGRWSVEPCTEVLLGTVREIREKRSDVFVVWYWAARSPFLLADGDMIFDKGLKMEAATPSSSPALLARDSGNLNIDQAIATADHIPLALQDSLGVWIGQVAWCNYMGSRGWEAALVLDEARGSTMLQVWGDLTLLDQEERRSLGKHLANASADAGFLGTSRAFGDPWAAEPYGYMRVMGEELTTTLINPALSRRSMQMPQHAGGEEVQLGPFEVVQLRHDATGPLRRFHSLGHPWDVHHHPIQATGTATPGTWQGELSLALPQLVHGDLLALSSRLHRDGIWWYHPDASELVSAAIRVAGRHGEPSAPARLVREPAVRARNGPGAPWVIFVAVAGSSWSHRDAQFAVAATLPDGVSPLFDAYVFTSASRA